MNDRIIRLIFAAFLVGSFWAPVSAAEEEPTSAWKGDLEVSYVQTDGNTNTKALLAAVKAAREFGFGSLSAEGKGIYGTTEVTQPDGSKQEVTSDKAWLGQLKYDQKITTRLVAFVFERAERNTPKGIEMRYTSQAGLGYTLIKAKKDLLKVEAGAGYVHENPVDPADREGYPTARAYALYEHSFTEKTRFTQWVEYLPDLENSENWLINEETAFITNLAGSLALKTSFFVAFDHEPPVGLKKSDRLFKTALLFTF